MLNENFNSDLYSISLDKGKVGQPKIFVSVTTSLEAELVADHGRTY